MVNRIRDYVDDIFNNTPKINKATELHDELLANLIEKYNDLLMQGKTEEEAYNIVIDGIGDMDELLGDLKVKNNQMAFEYMQEQRSRYALLLAVGVMALIGSFVFPIMIHNVTGAALMFLSWAVGVGIIIYANISKPHYDKKGDTIVEDFKKWSHSKNSNRSLYKAIKDSIGVITLVIYLLISFRTGGWWYTWVIFLISSAIQNVIKAFFDYRDR